ncbi:hypothetical protein TrVFT333_006424 [Trichoderma virens FT-333]|nr:hypothetical protein TrVFT333_006424 [Trichoderma virens FT-333]
MSEYLTPLACTSPRGLLFQNGGQAKITSSSINEDMHLQSDKSKDELDGTSWRTASERHSPSIFIIDNLAPEGDEEAPKLGLRLMRKTVREERDFRALIITFNPENLVMAIQQLMNHVDVYRAFGGSHSTIPAEWIEEFMTLKRLT